jgi:spore germination protein PD
MNFTVVNKNLNVDTIRILGVATAAVVLIGDAECIGASSIYDTPPESLIVGRSFVPLAPEGVR